jgi:hypothetical protein
MQSRSGGSDHKSAGKRIANQVPIAACCMTVTFAGRTPGWSNRYRNREQSAGFR